MYRAPTQDSACSVENVDGQGSQHGVVCVQAVVGEIVVPATESDRGGLRKSGGILDGNRHFVASQGASAQKSRSGYVRAGTERARRRPEDSVDVLKPGLAPNNVEAGRDGHRNDVDSLERDRQGNGTPRHVSGACARVRTASGWRARRA